MPRQGAVWWGWPRSERARATRTTWVTFPGRRRRRALQYGPPQAGHFTESRMTATGTSATHPHSPVFLRTPQVKSCQLLPRYEDVVQVGVSPKATSARPLAAGRSVDSHILAVAGSSGHSPIASWQIAIAAPRRSGGSKGPRVALGHSLRKKELYDLVSWDRLAQQEALHFSAAL